MPQLDKLTIIHQYVLLSLAFFCVFIFVSWVVLPSVYMALKLQRIIKQPHVVVVTLNNVNLRGYLSINKVFKSVVLSSYYNSQMISLFSVWLVILQLIRNEKY